MAQTNIIKQSKSNQAKVSAKGGSTCTEYWKYPLKPDAKVVTTGPGPLHGTETDCHYSSSQGRHDLGKGNSQDYRDDDDDGRRTRGGGY